MRIDADLLPAVGTDTGPNTGEVAGASRASAAISRPPRRCHPDRASSRSPRGGSRSLVHLGDRDRRRYEAAVAAVIPSVERALTRGVVANRARRRSPRASSSSPGGLRGVATCGRLAGWHRKGRVVPRSSATCATATAPSRLATVERALRRTGCSVRPMSSVSSELLRQLRATAGCEGYRSARPLRPCSPTPCSRRSTSPRRGGRTARRYRWVDDVVVFTRIAAAAHGAPRRRSSGRWADRPGRAIRRSADRRRPSGLGRRLLELRRTSALDMA